MEDEIQKTTDIKQVRGANLEKARAAKAAKRAAEVQQPADDGYAAMQEAQQTVQGVASPAEPVAAARAIPVRSNGRTEFIGRGGEVLTRGNLHSHDQFDVPNSMIPKGWEYQWNTVSVTGNNDIARDQMQYMYQSGWRSVPAERHAGILIQPGAKGEIVRGGMRLEERPEEMGNQARAEELRLAKQLISDRNESLKLSGLRKSMGDGFEMGKQYRGTGGDIRMSIDRALDAPAPSHKLAEPGE
jgi:hypothetical protein